MLQVGQKMCRYISGSIRISAVTRVTPTQAVLENGDKIYRKEDGYDEFSLVGDKWTCYIKADENALRQFDEQQEFAKLRVWKSQLFSLDDLRKMYAAVNEKDKK
jgi:hypothetical protein